MRSHLNLTAVRSWLYRAADHVAGVVLILLAAGMAVAYLPTPTASPQAPTTVAYDTALDDAQSEGQDVLPLSFHDADVDVWNALVDTHPEWYDDDVTGGVGTFYIPVGTVVDFPGGLYLATIDGWGKCVDGETFNGECSATGPVVMLDIPTHTAASVYGTTSYAQCGTDGQCAALAQDRALATLGTMTVGATDAARQVRTVAYSAPTAALSGQCVQAARDILRASVRASRHGGPRIEEDLSYVGMGDRAAQCNDALATAYFSDGHQFRGHHGPRLRAWLRQVIQRGQVYAPAGTAPVV